MTPLSKFVFEMWLLLLLWWACRVQSLLYYCGAFLLSHKSEGLSTVFFLCGVWMIWDISVWGFDCVKSFWFHSFGGKKVFHILDRDPTYKVDLWPRLYLSIITKWFFISHGGCDLFRGKISRQGKLPTYLLQTWTLFWLQNILAYLDLCFSIDNYWIWIVYWVYLSVLQFD